MPRIDRREFLLALGALSGATLLPTALRADTGPMAQNKPPADAPGIDQVSTDRKIPTSERESMQWWRKARFGMFIHFGLYALPARGEWVQWREQIPVREYAKLAGQFNPVSANVRQWANIAKEAGMKYAVLTARHHDGFALFDDPDNPFTSVNTAAHQDIVAEYASAARKAGLHVGLYYSPLDWRFPGFFFPNLQLENAEQMRLQYHRQIRQLMQNYGKIDVLWFDGGETDWLSFSHDMSDTSFPKLKPGQHYHGQFSWQGTEVNRIIRSLQPQIVVNNRAAGVPPDYQVREWTIGDFDDATPWETAFPLAGYWGYAGDKEPMSLKDAIHLLVNVAGRDGNLLMNVGPRADGTIQPSHVERLKEIGTWLGKYGESIYETRGGPFMPGKYGASTHRGQRVYIHVLDSKIDTLALPPIPAKVIGASSLTGESVRVSQDPAALNLHIQRSRSNTMDAIIVLEIDRPASSIRPMATI